MSEQAVQSLESALLERTRHFSRMSGDDLLKASIDLIRESDVEFTEAEKIPAILARVAAAGSIDAVAMMVAMGCAQEDVASALLQMAERSEDLMDGLMRAGLAATFEEWAEEEIKAGRMIKHICPESGKALYSTVEHKTR